MIIFCAAVLLLGPMKNNITAIFCYFFTSLTVIMCLNNGHNRNFFFWIKLNLGPYHVVALFPKTSAEKSTVHWLKKKGSSDIAEIDLKNYFSCPKWTKKIGYGEMCATFQTDEENLNVVVYPNPNNMCFKHYEPDNRSIPNNKSCCQNEHICWISLKFN